MKKGDKGKKEGKETNKIKTFMFDSFDFEKHIKSTGVHFIIE